MTVFLNQESKKIGRHIPSNFIAFIEKGHCLGFSLCYGMAAWLDKHSKQGNGKNLARWQAILKYIQDWDEEKSSDDIECELPALGSSQLAQKEDKQGGRGLIEASTEKMTLTQIFEIAINVVMDNQAENPLTSGESRGQFEFLEPQAPLLSAEDKKPLDLLIIEPQHLELAVSKEILKVRQRYQAGSFNPTKPKSLALLKQCLEEAQTQQHIAGGICLVYSISHACFLDFDIETQQWSFYDPNYEDNKAKYFNDLDLLVKEMSSSLSDKAIGFDLIHLTWVEEQPFFKSFNEALADAKKIQGVVDEDEFCDMAHLTPRTMLSILAHPYARERFNQKDSKGETVLMIAAGSLGSIEMVELLLKHGAEPLLKNSRERNALHYAIEYKRPQIVRLILDKAPPGLVNQQSSAGVTILHEAVERGDVDLVKKLLEYKADPNIKDDKERAALHYAVRSGNLEVLELILKAAAPELLNQKSASGWTVLRDAVAKGNVDVVKKLLEHKADPGQTNNQGQTVLHYAIELKRPQIIELILKKAVPELVNEKRSHGWTALHEAVEQADVDLVKKLLEYKADPNIKDDKDRTALHGAIKSRNLEVLELILKAATPELLNRKGVGGLTALHKAVIEDDVDVVKKLLEHNADPNIRNDKGKTVLHDAIESEEPEILELILKVATPELLNRKGAGGWTALHYAVKKDDVDVVKKLLEHKADPNIKDHKERTALVYAMELGNSRIVQLISEKATPELGNEKRPGSLTALHEAVAKGDIDGVKNLLEHKADLDIKDKKRRTALHCAVMSENLEILELILKSSTLDSLDQKKVDGLTALHDAVVKNNVDLVKKLLEHKADPNIKDNREKTALHLAIRLKNRKIIKLFGKSLGVAEGKEAYEGGENEIIRKIMGVYSNSCKNSYFNLSQYSIAAVKELLKSKDEFTIELFLEKFLEEIQIERINSEDSFMKCIINLCQLFPEAPSVDLQDASSLGLKAN